MVCSRSLIRYLLSSPYFPLQNHVQDFTPSVRSGNPVLPSFPPPPCTPESCLLWPGTACPEAGQDTFAPHLRLKQCKEGMTQIVSLYRSAVASTFGLISSSSCPPGTSPGISPGAPRKGGSLNQAKPSLSLDLTETSWPHRQKTCLEVPQGVARNGTSWGKRPRGSAD